jgi:endonuclease/exonuclease/phosphatase (EEP) superfamily protein YafD
LNTFLCNPWLFTCNEGLWAEPVIKDFLSDGWTDLLQGFNGWTQQKLGLEQRLDWLFSKGVTPSAYWVLQQITAADHVPVVATVTVP